MNKDNRLPDDKEVLEFQLKRVFAVLSRNILTLLEDLKEFHGNNFNKLRDGLPPEYEKLIDMSDYFDNNCFEHYRKRVLDNVMSAKRDLEFSVKNIQD